MSLVRSGAIAARKVSATRERYVVNDDGRAAEPRRPLTFLAILGAVDAVLGPVSESWSPTAQVLLSAATTILAAGLFGAVILGRYSWRTARAIGPPLLRGSALLLLLLVAAPFRFVFGRPIAPKRKPRSWWARALRVGM